MKGFPYVDTLARSFGYGPVVSGIIFFGILAGCKMVISLPFSLYSTFVIEEKFGFNNTTVKTFIIDALKGLLLGVVIGIPVSAAIIWFFQYTGELSWLYCWVTLTLFVILMQYIFPTVIMPLFNKFEPMEEGDLKQSVINYAKSIDFPLQNLFVMDGSKRSSKSNAFFTGFGKSRRIVLFDTLIKNHTVNEIVAVLAHEMGHFKKKHIIKTMIISILHTGFLFFLLSVFLSYQGLYDAFFMQEKSVYAGLIFFSLLYSPVELFLGIFLQMYSRKNEYEADAFAAETTKMPEEMITALKKLSSDNLSNLLPHPFYVLLNYSHPPVLKRIEQLKIFGGV
jgi:STE24 endopeptidase